MKLLDLPVRMSTADKTQMRAAFGLELNGAGQARQMDQLGIKPAFSHLNSMLKEKHHKGNKDKTH